MPPMSPCARNRSSACSSSERAVDRISLAPEQGPRGRAEASRRPCCPAGPRVSARACSNCTRAAANSAWNISMSPSTSIAQTAPTVSSRSRRIARALSGKRGRLGWLTRECDDIGKDQQALGEAGLVAQRAPDARALAS